MAKLPCHMLPLEATRRSSSCSSQQARSPRDLHKRVCLAFENNLYTFRIMKVLINDYKVNVSGVGLVYEALTPLQIACACDDIEIVQILIEAGAV